jgi:uncharacterized protein (TIGR03545 family)
MIIRWKFFISVLVFVGAVSWILLFCLDGMVKSALESGISAFTNTKTDVSGLRISLMNSSLRVKRLEIASKSDPMKNTIEFSDITIDFQTLPLLERRLIVDDFSVTGIQWGTVRKTSGLLPRKAPREETWYSGISDKAFEKLEGEFSELPVSQLTTFSIPDNVDEILSRLDFPSLDAFKKVATDAQDIKASVTARLKEIADLSDEKKILSEARELTKNVPQDPAEILRRAELIGSFIKKLGEQKAEYEGIFGQLKKDYESAEKSYRLAESSVQDTYRKARDLVGVKALDTRSIMKIIFGTQWVKHAHETMKMHAELRRVLSHITQGSDDEIQIYPRASGRDIVFVTPKKKPSIVLTKSEFSVNVLDGGDRKDIEQRYALDLRNITSAPSLSPEPMKAKIQASFKDMMVAEVNLDAHMDYRKPDFKDVFRAEVRRIRASEWPVGIPKLFPVKISSGTADAQVEFEFVGSQLTWKNVVKFQGVKWDFSEVPKAGLLTPLLEKIFEDVSNFTVGFTLNSRNQAIDLDVSSDLSSLIQEGVSRLLDMKLKELQAKIQRAIDGRIEASKELAAQGLKDLKDQAMSAVSSRIDAVNASTGELRGYLDDLTQKTRDVAEDKVKSGLQKLQKRAPSLPKLKF